MKMISTKSIFCYASWKISIRNLTINTISLLFLVPFVFLTNTIYAQDPNLPPSGNFELIDWKVTLPDQTEIKEQELSNGFESADEFYTDPVTGAMVFKCRNDGETGGSTYPRSELREMLRAGNTSISTTGIGLNNWVFSTSSQANQDASGGVDGTLTATVAVNHVSTSGESAKIGRVIIGQIHASSNEPCRLYYRKLPGNSKGSIYIAHEPATGPELWFDMIGSRSSTASDPVDGVALNEQFSYEIDVVGNTLTVTIIRPGKPDVIEIVDMSASQYANDWMYFKAGCYNQNNTGTPGDYAQVSFFALNNTHTNTNGNTNNPPSVSITSPSNGANFNSGDNVLITAGAFDNDGSVSQVEFFINGNSIGVDTTSPYSLNWTIGIGSYNVTAVATDNESASTTSSVINITGVVEPVELYVSSIVTSTQNAGKGKKFGVATITILDNNGTPVSNATVTGTFSGTFNETVSSTTDNTGNAELVTTASAKGNLTIDICVDNVTHNTLTYNSSLNTITCTGSSAKFLPTVNSESISDEIVLENIEVYPNPFSSYFTLDVILENNSKFSAKISSTDGKLVLLVPSQNLTKGSHKIEVNTSSLSSGIYILETTINGERKISTLIK